MTAARLQSAAVAAIKRVAGESGIAPARVHMPKLNDAAGLQSQAQAMRILLADGVQVKELANVFHINPDTVRRRIRSNVP